MKSQWRLGGFWFTTPRDPDFCTWEYTYLQQSISFHLFVAESKYNYEENPRKINDFQGKGSRIPKPQLLGDFGGDFPYFSPPCEVIPQLR